MEDGGLLLDKTVLPVKFVRLAPIGSQGQGRVEVGQMKCYCKSLCDNLHCIYSEQSQTGVTQKTILILIISFGSQDEYGHHFFLNSLRI